MKQQSTHAECAKMIRKDLKLAFPLVKFSVRSDISSVNVEWDNGPSSDDVRMTLGKYTYGSFDSMQDCYEFTNVSKDIPQVQYVFVRRNICEAIIQQVFAFVKDTHVYFGKLGIDESSNELMNHWSSWTPREFIQRLLRDEDLTNGYKIS